MHPTLTHKYAYWCIWAEAAISDASRRRRAEVVERDKAIRPTFVVGRRCGKSLRLSFRIMEGDGSKKQRQNSQKPASTRNHWQELMCAVLLYQFATSMQGTAMCIYKYFQSRREPGAVAPSLNKAAALANAKVNKAAAKLAKAQAKAEAAQSKVSSASAKGKAKAKSTPSGSSSSSGSVVAGPPPKAPPGLGQPAYVNTNLPSSSSTSSSGGVPMNVTTAANLAKSKSRLVATGSADPMLATDATNMMPMSMMHQLLMAAQQNAALGTADMQSAFLQGVQGVNPEFYTIVECPGCGLQASLINGMTVCQSCGWMNNESHSSSSSSTDPEDNIPKQG